MARTAQDDVEFWAEIYNAAAGFNLLLSQLDRVLADEQAASRKTQLEVGTRLALAIREGLADVAMAQREGLAEIAAVLSRVTLASD